jgi:endonuclease-8
MPEVIEIRKYADFLKSHFKNKYLNNIEILKGRYKTHGPFALYKKFKSLLPLKLIDIKTKGKLLYFIFEKNIYLLSTLGLRGAWILYDPIKNKYKFPKLLNYINNENFESYKKPMLNNLNVKFEFRSSNEILYYSDTLSFGTLKVIDNDTDLEKKLKSIGPDIMDKRTTYEVFKNQILKDINMNKVIGNVLVNQKIISGIGNYLRSDILWLCRISPFRKVRDLKDTEIYKIYKNALALTWGDYNLKSGLKKKIIDKDHDLPKYYKRNFFVYMENKDIYNNPVIVEPLYEGSQKRFIYWVSRIQK